MINTTEILNRWLESWDNKKEIVSRLEKRLWWKDVWKLTSLSAARIVEDVILRIIDDVRNNVPDSY